MEAWLTGTESKLNISLGFSSRVSSRLANSSSRHPPPGRGNRGSAGRFCRASGAQSRGRFPRRAPSRMLVRESLLAPTFAGIPSCVRRFVSRHEIRGKGFPRRGVRDRNLAPACPSELQHIHLHAGLAASRNPSCRTEPPILRRGDQPLAHRILMQVPHLLLHDRPRRNCLRMKAILPE